MNSNYCPVCDLETFETEFKLKDFVVLHVGCYDKAVNDLATLMRCDRCRIKKGNWFEEDGGRILCRQCREDLMQKLDAMSKEEKEALKEE